MTSFAQWTWLYVFMCALLCSNFIIWKFQKLRFEWISNVLYAPSTDKVQTFRINRRIFGILFSERRETEQLKLFHDDKIYKIFHILRGSTSARTKTIWRSVRGYGLFSFHRVDERRCREQKINLFWKKAYSILVFDVWNVRQLLHSFFVQGRSSSFLWWWTVKFSLKTRKFTRENNGSCCFSLQQRCSLVTSWIMCAHEHGRKKSFKVFAQKYYTHIFCRCARFIRVRKTRIFYFDVIENAGDLAWWKSFWSFWTVELLSTASKFHWTVRNFSLLTIDDLSRAKKQNWFKYFTLNRQII